MWGDAQIEAWIHEQIIEWSGNQTREGSESLTAARVRQFLTGSVLSDGRVIFAIPEVVVEVISSIRIKGASALNPSCPKIQTNSKNRASSCQ